MIVVSAGIQKAGTGWYFNMTNDLIVASGGSDIRQVRDQFHLHFLLKYYNCNIGRPMIGKLIPLLVPHLLRGSFVVKTHSSPPSTWAALAKWGPFRATFIYRDPRDVAISAFDHGQKLRQKGKTHSFARLGTREEAIYATHEWLQTWERWHKSPHTLLIRYEDLRANPLQELVRLANFLGIQLPGEKLAQIVAAYQQDEANLSQQIGLHYNKGVAQRYQQEMTPDQLALSETLFRPYLGPMGYLD